MMRKCFIQISCVLCCWLLFSHCEEPKQPGDYVLDTFSVVSEFPQNYQIDHGQPVDLGVIGVMSFRIVDTLLLVSTRDAEGFRTIISLPNRKSYGSYLKVGNGPDEFIDPISLSHSQICISDHGVQEMLYDYIRGKCYLFDISETIRCGDLQMSLVADSLPRRGFNFIPISSDFYFFRTLGKKALKSYRFFMRSGSCYTTRDLDIMNASGLHDIQSMGLHGGLHSSIIRISPDKSMLVECPRYFGLINLIPTDKDMSGKTIRVADRWHTFESLEATPRREWITYIQTVRAYPSCFAVLWMNETRSDNRRIEGENYRILFFDWDGNPLAQLQLDRRVTYFDIDFRTSELYVLDKSDEFYKYDISHILSALHLYPE